MKPIFLLDVDEVLADFSGRAAHAMSRVLGRPWTIDEAPTDEWDMFSVLTNGQYRVVSAIIDAPGWCSEISPISGSRAAVKRLRELCEVYIVTGHRVRAEQWVLERTQWLERHFGFAAEDLVHTHAKFLVGGDFLLDDRPDCVEAWIEKHPQGKGMLWSTEHNKRLEGYDGIRVYSWDEVFRRVGRWTKT